jgi:hypothetical protein
MAVALTISTKELERQAKLVFEGKAYKLFLAANSGGLTAESTAAAWEAVEVSGGGYSAATGTLAAGAYSAGNARYELPTINATFTATGGGFNYNTICLRIGTELYLHSITTETPSITLSAGQSKSYTITLAQDD